MVRCVLSSNKRCDDTYISQIIFFSFFMGTFDFFAVGFYLFLKFQFISFS